MSLPESWQLDTLSETLRVWNWGNGPDDNPQEFLTFSQLKEKVKQWPYPEMDVPVFVPRAHLVNFQAFCNEHGLSYEDVAGDQEVVAMPLLTIALSNLELLATLDPKFYCFQDPHSLLMNFN